MAASIPPVDDPEVIARVVAILAAHRPAKVDRRTRKVDLPEREAA